MTVRSPEVSAGIALRAATARRHLPALVPGLVVVGLMLVWEISDGGYDPQTWYWGALVALGLLAAIVIAAGSGRRLGRDAKLTLALFTAYVCWCYCSIAWAQSPGSALNGANQALLYLLVYAAMLLLPWTAPGALAALAVYATGVGATAVVLLFRLASADRVAVLIVDGRLSAPTGYFNSTAALFNIGALIAIALSARRELPGLLRGLLAALACADLQMALIVQSRGWLFTLPLIAVVAIFAVQDRLRAVAATLIPVAGTVVIVHRLLAVYGASAGPPLNLASERAGQPALLVCAAAFVVGTLLAWADGLRGDAPLRARTRRALGVSLAVIAAIAVAGTGSYVTHGHPVRFIVRQWDGFSHEPTGASPTSHFLAVGSGRYDFWRSSLAAFGAHPIGGLGDANFGFWYLRHRMTSEEPTSPHSIEFSLLSETGIVGFLLFAGFLVGALRLALGARRRQADELTRAAAGIGLLALIVWLIHGSLDWFWEIPALSGPALGFLGVAGGLAPARVPAPAPANPGLARSRPAVRALATTAGALALIATVVVLGVPYLAVREVSLGTSAAGSDPQAALADFRRAADLNPLWSVPGRLAGVVALEAGQPATARRWFEQAIAREPGGWFAWLGAGLAASAQGQPVAAHRYFETAIAIDGTQAVIRQALARSLSARPLTISQALKLVVVQ